ncbi:DUF1580 domain-containing protein [Gemmata sp.]|uniref:DUF1580 domain-containing protein n=1 Tax=Gemmata sp. TaxID=1914242 RepID=UPI003F70FC4F
MSEQNTEVVTSPAAALVERILAEGPIGMGPAASIIGTFAAGKRVAPSTITRWIGDGVKLAGGRVVRLEAVKIAGRLVTSKQAVVRFIVAQQATAPAPPADTSTPRGPGRRRAASEKAGRELEKLGA